MVSSRLSSRSVLTMRALSSGPIPAIGSSSRSMRGLVARAIAISSWRCSPWLRLETTTSARPASPTRASAVRAGERRVFVDGKIEEQRGDLERSSQAELAAAVGGQRRHVAAFETDAPGVGGDLAGELADQGGLARAVRPDDGVKLPLRHAKRNGVRGDDASEALGQFLDLEQRISHGALPPAGRRYRRVQTARPAGTGVRARSANIRPCEPPHPRTRETPWPGSRSEAPPPATATLPRR